MNDVSLTRARLLGWYDRNRRDLPWRAPPGARADPYLVWLSEIMLQQTTVAVVRRYFIAFVSAWPDVAALAAARDEEVMRAWAGLGYYARARNLLKCARRIVDDLGGRFPREEAVLAALPGIGPYTAAAIAAIAFDEPTVPVDGNVERVVARYFAVREPLPAAKPKLRALARTLRGTERSGDFAQALMDLGAMVCAPRRADCGRCPLAAGCAAHKQNIASLMPAKAARAARPTRTGVAFWVERADGAVLLRRRRPRGLLGGMSEVPSSDWAEDGIAEARALAAAPVDAEWSRIGRIGHTFTHFHLRLDVWGAWTADEPVLREAADPERCFWVERARLADAALPSVMRKVVALASRHAL